MKTSPRMATNYVCPLRAATRVSDCGGKAGNLARMLALGLPVPDGIVLTNSAFEDFCDANGLPRRAAAASMRLDPSEIRLTAQSIAEKIETSAIPAPIRDAVVEELGELRAAGPLIVRSSAVGEDGARASFAGQLDSFPDMEEEERLFDAIRACWASYWSERCLFYQASRRVELGGMAIIIQKQVAARFSGVLFTRNPDAPEALLVEYCHGAGDALVSGRISPGRITVRRADLQCQSLALPESAQVDDAVDRLADAQVVELARLGLILERQLGGPQDIEWTIDGEGRLFLVQSRPITAPSRKNARSTNIVWSNANINENFPAPVCPLLYSIAAAGYYHYFRNLGLAFGIAKTRVREMEHPLRHLIGVHGGRLYYNLSNIHTVLCCAPFGGILAGLFDAFIGCEEPSRAAAAPRRGGLSQGLQGCWIGLRAAWQFLFLRRRVAAFEKLIHEFAERTTPADLEAKSLNELLDDFRGFLDIRCHRWLNASLADAAAMLSYGALARLLGQAFPGKEHAALCPTLLKGLPGLVSGEPVAELWELAQLVRRESDLTELLLGESPEEFLVETAARPELGEFRNRWTAFLERFGFRRSGELMLTVPGFQENPAELVGILRAHVLAEGPSPVELQRRQDEGRRAKTALVAHALGRRGLWRLLPWPSKRLWFQFLLRATHQSIALRERARLKQAQLYSRCRAIALAIGAKLMAQGRLANSDDVFQLTYQEIDLLLAGSAMFAHQVKELVALRQAAQARLLALRPPDRFELPAGEYWDADRPALVKSAAGESDGQEGVLSGVGACGGRATGAAAILHDVSELERLRPGDVLVTKQTDPGWGPVFPLIKGLVIERGGMLSHGAILAREYGIPAVVGVRDATRRIAQRQLLVVDGDQGIVERVG